MTPNVTSNPGRVAHNVEEHQIPRLPLPRTILGAVALCAACKKIAGATGRVANSAARFLDAKTARLTGEKLDAAAMRTAGALLGAICAIAVLSKTGSERAPGILKALFGIAGAALGATTGFISYAYGSRLKALGANAYKTLRLDRIVAAYKSGDPEGPENKDARSTRAAIVCGGALVATLASGVALSSVFGMVGFGALTAIGLAAWTGRNTDLNLKRGLGVLGALAPTAILGAGLGPIFSAVLGIAAAAKPARNWLLARQQKKAAAQVATDDSTSVNLSQPHKHRSNQNGTFSFVRRKNTLVAFLRYNLGGTTYVSKFFIKPTTQNTNALDGIARIFPNLNNAYSCLSLLRMCGGREVGIDEGRSTITVRDNRKDLETTIAFKDSATAQEKNALLTKIYSALEGNARGIRIGTESVAQFKNTFNVSYVLHRKANLKEAEHSHDIRLSAAGIKGFF